jgi:hypothetical protein
MNAVGIESGAASWSPQSRPARAGRVPRMREGRRDRVYRWGEEGLLGITDRECRFCFALPLGNGKHPTLKERLFSLTGPQGNHGLRDGFDRWPEASASPFNV